MQNKTLGILGGGQLGRMSALAAARLGIKVVIFTPEENSPASHVAWKTIIADYDDQKALAELAGLVDVISYEFENIPAETITYLKTLKPVYPDEKLLNVSQDRLKEKQFLNDCGIQTAKWCEITDETSLHATLKEWDTEECIIKTARFGYDGKGQIRYNTAQNLNDACQNLNGPLIAEEIIKFSHELSVVTARNQNNDITSYGPMLNEHENHILSKTIVPAPVNDAVSKQAVAMGENLAKKLDLIGILTLELFLTENDTLLANEIAPRTHNSGHWTIDACTCSQFENHVRTVCGLPIGSSTRHSDATMLNLIGEDVHTHTGYLKQENACIHLYGKQDIKQGRKMGHITLLKEKS